MHITIQASMHYHYCTVSLNPLCRSVLQLFGNTSLHKHYIYIYIEHICALFMYMYIYIHVHVQAFIIVSSNKEVHVHRNLVNIYQYKQRT